MIYSVYYTSYEEHLEYKFVNENNPSKEQFLKDVSSVHYKILINDYIPEKRKELEVAQKELEDFNNLHPDIIVNEENNIKYQTDFKIEETVEQKIYWDGNCN